MEALKLGTERDLGKNSHLSRPLHVNLPPIVFARRRAVLARRGRRLHSGVPEVGVLEVQRVGRFGGCAHDSTLYSDVVALLHVGDHEHLPGHYLTLLHEDGLLQKAPHLIPVELNQVCQRQSSRIEQM